MDNELMFSIIIPVYKVEQYIEECVNSILGQRFSDYEVILIDDGSPDNSPELCENYALKYKKVRVIHKSNGGSSSARNRGLEEANGKYVIFVDSDDYWNTDNALDLISERINECDNVDVLIFNSVDYSCISGQSVVCNRHYNVELMENRTKEEVLDYLFRSGLFPGAAWVTVTRREFLVENSISFIEGIKGEDIDWLLNVFVHAKKFSALNEAFYVYRKYRVGSVTNTADTKSMQDLLFILELWCKKLEMSEYKTIKEKAYSFLCTHYLCAVLISCNVSRENQKRYQRYLEQYKFLMAYHHSAIIRMCKWVPVRLLAKLLKSYQNLRQF